MSTNGCPDPETLALFALGGAPGEEWRGVVRHLADCDLCRRQVALAAEEIPAELPRSERIEVGIVAPRPRVWHRVAQGVAAAALIAAGLAWALLQRRQETPADGAPAIVRPDRAPERRPAPVPEPLPPRVVVVPEPPPAPKERPVPEPRPFPPGPTVEANPPPGPSPFLAERARSEVSQSIEISAGAGTVSCRSGDITTALSPRTTILPSDTLLSPAGGSVVLADGSTIHLAPETELRLSWSQTHACTTVDVRKGDAIVDLGRTPKPLLVTNGSAGVHLRDSEGTLCVSTRDQSLRTTLLSGASQFRTKAGEPRPLPVHQTLVLGEAGDTLEPALSPDLSRFSTLGSAGRGAPAPAPPPTPLPPEKRPPLLDVLATALGSQSYAYRVSGRQVRDGVWSPAGIYTSIIEEFTAARRIDDRDPAQLKRGSRPWNDLGKGPLPPRDARLVEILRSAQPPHQMILEMLPSFRGESAPRTEKVRDRICVVWEIRLDPIALRGFMERILEGAVAEGRLEKPDVLHWDSLEGSLEIASLKFDPKLLRIVDRRKVSYSYKTVAGFDRRTYHLETVYEFFSHGVAALQIPPDLFAPNK